MSMDLWWDNAAPIEDLLGKTLVSAHGNVGGEELVFVTTDGDRYCFFHAQDCCESVEIEDICGELQDLVGHPLLTARCDTNSSAPVPEYAESFTWTFYNFATIRGTVTVRWLGRSNGYYSEEVRLTKEPSPAAEPRAPATAAGDTPCAK